MFKNERDEVGFKCGNIDFVIRKDGKGREFVTSPPFLESFDPKDGWNYLTPVEPKPELPRSVEAKS